MTKRRKTRLLREDPDDETTASIHKLRTWWPQTHEAERFRAEGFKQAAEILVESVASRFEADWLVCPILVLYRHHLELMLKCVLTHQRLVKEGKVSGEWPSREHNLHKLWNGVKDVIDHEIPRSTDNFFRTLTEFDRDGQGAKYSRDTEGEPTLEKAPAMLGLKNFGKLVDEASVFLYGVMCDYDAAEDSAAEA